MPVQSQGYAQHLHRNFYPDDDILCAHPCMILRFFLCMALRSHQLSRVQSLLMTDFLDALKQISFDIDKFQARYVSDRTNQIIQEAFSRNKTA